MGSSPTSRTILFSAPAAIGSRVGFKNRMFWVRIPGGAPVYCACAGIWHTGWSQKPMFFERESSSLSTRTTLNVPLLQSVRRVGFKIRMFWVRIPGGIPQEFRACDVIGSHTGLRTRVLWVRVPPRAPPFLMRPCRNIGRRASFRN